MYIIRGKKQLKLSSFCIIWLHYNRLFYRKKNNHQLILINNTYLFSKIRVDFKPQNEIIY